MRTPMRKNIARFARIYAKNSARATPRGRADRAQRARDHGADNARPRIEACDSDKNVLLSVLLFSCISFGRSVHHPKQARRSDRPVCRLDIDRKSTKIQPPSDLGAPLLPSN